MRAKSRAPRRIVLGTAGAASLFALAACQEETSDVIVFDSEASCEAAEGVDAAECEAAYEQALAEHRETAPRYDAQAVCEEQHGPGACVAEEAPGGGSIFLPLMTGFLLGQLLGGGMRSRPLVGAGRGGFATTDGSVRTSSLSGRGAVAGSALNARPASTRGAAPLTRSAVARTGGFGAARTGGGFGG